MSVTAIAVSHVMPEIGKYYAVASVVSHWNLNVYTPFLRMGKLLHFELIGAMHDPDPKYTFEKGVIWGLHHKYKEYDPLSAEAELDKTDLCVDRGSVVQRRQDELLQE
jgi:hypothetical protein